MTKDKVDEAHQGLHPYRYADNALEHAFALAWQRQDMYGGTGPSTLDYLMDIRSRGYPNPPLTTRERLLANTLMQWLGSPVGQCMLREVLSTPEAKDFLRSIHEAADQVEHSKNERPAKTWTVAQVEAETCDVPWNRGIWHGSFVSLDGAYAGDFNRNDIAEVCFYGRSGGRWDGTSAGVVRLHDGRYVAWESVYGPTGSGFHCDAYGGDADIAFASDLETAKRYVSEHARECWR